VLDNLAGLLDDRLGHALAVLYEPALHLLHDLGATVEAERLPPELGGAALARKLRDLFRAQVRDVGDRLPGGRVLNRDRGSVARSPTRLLDRCHAAALRCRPVGASLTG